MADSARIIITVMAGIMPGDPDEKFTQRWTVSSKEWERSNGFQIALDRMALASSYALNLQLASTQGHEPNWVVTEWAWL